MRVYDRYSRNDQFNLSINHKHLSENECVKLLLIRLDYKINTLLHEKRFYRVSR